MEIQVSYHRIYCCSDPNDGSIELDYDKIESASIVWYRGRTDLILEIP